MPIVALALLALILPSLILAAWYLDSRARDRDTSDLRAGHERDRLTWDRERQILLNRIKPETAQYVAEPGPVKILRAPSFDNDEEYWTANESKEELAERMLRDELEQARAAVEGVAV